MKDMVGRDTTTGITTIEGDEMCAFMWGIGPRKFLGFADNSVW